MLLAIPGPVKLRQNGFRVPWNGSPFTAKRPGLPCCASRCVGGANPSPWLAASPGSRRARRSRPKASGCRTATTGCSSRQGRCDAVRRRRAKGCRNTWRAAWSRGSARFTPPSSWRSSAKRSLRSSRPNRRGWRRSTASARAGVVGSRRLGRNRRSSGRSWSSCTPTAWAPVARCGSTRRTETRRSTPCAPTLTGWPKTFRASGSRVPTRSRNGSGCPKIPWRAPGPA